MLACCADRMHIEYTVAKLRGAKYKDDLAQYVKAGSELTLRREPDNPYDRDAILVLAVVPSQGSQPVPIGYVAKGAADRIAQEMDAGRTFRAVFAGGGSSTPFVVVLASANGDELKLTKLKHR